MIYKCVTDISALLVALATCSRCTSPCRLQRSMSAREVVMPSTISFLKSSFPVNSARDITPLVLCRGNEMAKGVVLLCRSFVQVNPSQEERRIACACRCQCEVLHTQCSSCAAYTAGALLNCGLFTQLNEQGNNAH
jgi:hypothetical protein